MSEINARKVALNATSNTYFSLNTDDGFNVIVKNEYLYSFGVGYTFTDKPVYLRAGTVGATVGSMLVLDAAEGNWAPITWRNWADSTRRWEIGKEDTTEGGSNTGSHLYFSRFSDAGNWISNPIFLNRYTGNVGINNIYTPSARLEVGGNIKDDKGDLRQIPLNSQTDYVLTITDVGKVVAATGNVTVPNAVFSSGDVISVYNNNSVSRNVTNAGAVTMRIAGQSDSNTRVLAQYGIATILCVAANTFVISGAGLT